MPPQPAGEGPFAERHPLLQRALAKHVGEAQEREQHGRGAEDHAEQGVAAHDRLEPFEPRERALRDGEHERGKATRADESGEEPGPLPLEQAPPTRQALFAERQG